MPCRILIKKNVENLVDKYSQRGLSMSLQDANILASNVNTKMKHHVVSFFNDNGKVGRNIDVPSELVDKYFRIEVLRRTPTVGGTNSELEMSLVNGFLKDFNISVEKYNDLKEDLGIDAYTASDLITKTIAYKEGESILPEVAYFAFMMLGYENNKLRSDLRYLISKWDKYRERFEYHKDIVNKKEGFIKDKVKWRRKINDLIILDFFQENIKSHFENPVEFKKRLDRRWTKDDYTIWQKFMRGLKAILQKFALYKKQNIKELQTIGLSIADEVLNRNYDYFKYDKADEQIRKYYNQTIQSDAFAKEIVENAQDMGLVLTGSLALRRSGTVYRTVEETLHDIDFIVPFDIANAPGNEKIIDNIIRHQGIDVDFASDIAMRELQNATWYKEFIEKNPSFEITNGFYGKDNGYSSYTLQGVINPERYDSDGVHQKEHSHMRKDPVTKREYKVDTSYEVKHSKGDIIKGTGYAIDLFVRLNPGLDQHENYFKLWKEIMIAKIAMGRGKDFTDWKHFVPYLKSKNSFNFNYEAYRHLNYEQSEGGALQDVTNVINNKLELDIKNLNLTPEVVNYLYQDSKAKSTGKSVESYKKEISKIINNLQSDFTSSEILETIKCI